MATAIDTLSTYEAIAATGIDDKGARAISKAIADSAAAYRTDLATKTDIIEVKGDISELRALTKVNIAEVRADIALVRELIASTQNRTMVWMFGMMVMFAGIIIAVIKLP